MTPWQPSSPSPEPEAIQPQQHSPACWTAAARAPRFAEAGQALLHLGIPRQAAAATIVSVQIAMARSSNARRFAGASTASS
jgi:hypothetical protein